MIVEKSMNDTALSNTYLAGEEGGAGFFVDAGGPVQPLFEFAEQHSIAPTHVLLTHHHGDHVWELEKIVARYPGIEVLADARERQAIETRSPELAPLITGDLRGGEDVQIGSLTITPLNTPGHTTGMLSLLAGGNVFTGDTLFKGSVGGVRGGGPSGYSDLKTSIMDVLLKLPPDTIIRPGHTDPTTVAEEWENNGFVRIWRGLDPEGDEPCTALGEPATLILLGDDYDGGHKAWIRWPDGRDDIVGGSRVERD